MTAAAIAAAPALASGCAGRTWCEATQTCPGSTQGGGAGLAGSATGGGRAGTGGTGLAGSKGGDAGRGGSSTGGDGGTLENGGSSSGTGGSASGSGGSGKGGDTALGGEGGEVTGSGGSAGDDSCPTGFTGPSCDIDIDDCASATCEDNAHCVDGIATFTCECDLGFTGTGCVPRFELLTPGFGASIGYAINADGTVVVGGVADAPQSTNKPFRWTATTGAVTLMSNTDPVDSGAATSVSADGNVVGGSAFLAAAVGTFRWTQSTGVTHVGPDDQGFLSSNGSTLAGRDLSQSNGAHLCRWTLAGGVADLGSVGSGVNVRAVSGDGTAIVGNVWTGSETRGFIWTSGDGLQKMGPTDTASEALAVSADGRVTVGGYSSDGDPVAFVWRRPQNFADLELGELTHTRATGITSDGSVIVGTTLSTSVHDSWIWSEAEGARSLITLLSDEGVDTSMLYSPQVTDVSDDGTIVTGSVTILDSGLGSQAFIARLGD